jgi:hypothetical protein
MKAADFQVVAEARRAAHDQLGFFNRMMAAKSAQASAARAEPQTQKTQTQTQAKPPEKK